MKELTNKQKQIYDFIVDFTSTNGYPPSIREICQAVGLKSPSSVHSYIKILQDAGYIQKTDKKTRALTPVSGAAVYGKVPILGRVTAGQPILAVEDIEGYLPFDQDGMTGSFFALRVEGRSMINAGIFDGDYVIVRKQPTALSGEIVVALIDDEATVKRLRTVDHQIWLMPENPEYEPINGNSCTILGVVKSLWRKY
mgnify:CR=1 FL=1